ncbi:hypothetical protein KFU94_37140 [Chloroflexi bacterium TSY]|nr:hypothetical protein [Chloroflexi bacterium TSY]
MRRIHLFEFEDQRWLPSTFRDLLTEVLQYQLTNSRLYRPIIPFIKEVLQQSEHRQVIDCCSGASGPWRYVLQMLKQDGLPPIEVVLTDKYPNLAAWERISQQTGGDIKYHAEPIDATAIPPSLVGFRVFFTSFHHFKPKMARKILQDAVDQNAPIGIFEFTERRMANTRTMLRSPLSVLSASTNIKPMTWSRFCWTYLIPIVPMIYWWDGTVSHLRTYTPEELKQFVAEINNDNYHWAVGIVPVKSTLYNGVVHFSWIDRFTLLETERTFIFSDFAGSQRENGLI